MRRLFSAENDAGRQPVDSGSVDTPGDAEGWMMSYWK